MDGAEDFHQPQQLRIIGLFIQRQLSLRRNGRQRPKKEGYGKQERPENGAQNLWQTSHDHHW
ncbi:MAG: hypothetical protein Kow0032_01730 [Methyloligellaceae bacterium]